MDSITIITDEKIAAMWIKEAEKSNNPETHFNVGLLFLTGQGLEVNVEQAIFWFSKAAHRGDIESMNNLAVIHAQGQGVEQNLPEAAKWFQKAADLGDEKAKRNLEKCLQIIDNSQ